MARDLFNRYIWLVDTLRMTYKSFWKPDGHTVEVGSYFIKIFRQRWYMIAFVPSRNVLRTYALDRILSLEATENTFSMPENFNPKEYFQNSFGVILDEKYPPEFIELKVYGTKRDYFRTLPLHRDKDRRGLLHIPVLHLPHIRLHSGDTLARL